MTVATAYRVPFEQDKIGALKEKFSGRILLPGDLAYDNARLVWNGMIDKYPGLIAMCASASDVAEAVHFARHNSLLVAVRGSGHNVAGNAVCDDGIVIDLSAMRKVEVNPEARTVRVEAGATLGEIDRATQPFGLAMPTGNVSVTGIAGLTLGGGLSWLRRKYGMTIDSLQSAEVITANGKLVTASAASHADLFWGIRGGGGNFGIVTSFTFQLHPVGPEVMFLSIMYPDAEADRVLKTWRAFTETAPDEVSSDALIWQIPEAPVFPEAIHGERVVGLAGMYTGRVDVGMRLLQPLREICTPLVDMSGPMPYVAVQSAFDPLFPAHTLRYFWKSLYLDHMNDDLLQALLAWTDKRPSPLTFVPIRHLGGAIRRAPDAATAFSNRRFPYLLSIDMTWIDPADDEQNIAWTRAFWNDMQRFSNGGVFVNFAGPGEESTALTQAIHGANYPRMQALKEKYDPENLFRLNHNIKPAL